jgi:hypothetical protein
VARDLGAAHAGGRGWLGSSPWAITRLLGVATAAALGIDTYVHAHDAAFYDAVRTSVISQGTLFRLEAAVAALIAVVLLIRPSRFWFAAALVVAASAFGAVMLYTYVDVGTLGPLPNMYEPTWALPGKAASAWAEGVGIILAAAGLLTTWRVRAPRPHTGRWSWSAVTVHGHRPRTVADQGGAR